MTSVFGFFSGGKPIATFDDFKYNCLQRLNLKNQLQEKELDFFIDNVEQLQGKTRFVEADFLIIFRHAMRKALESLDLTDSVTDRSTRRRHASSSKKMSLNDFLRDEVHKILVKCIMKTSYDDMFDQGRKRRDNTGHVERVSLEDLLHNYCLVAEEEARRVVKYLTVGGKILCDNFFKEL